MVCIRTIIVFLLLVKFTESTQEFLKSAVWTELVTNKTILIVDKCENLHDKHVLSGKYFDFETSIVRFTEPTSRKLFAMKGIYFDLVVVVTDSDNWYKVSLCLVAI